MSSLSITNKSGRAGLHSQRKNFTGTLIHVMKSMLELDDMEESIQPYGLVLKSSLAIREFLELAVSLANPDSSKILSSAGKYVFSDEVPYTAIRDIWFQIEPSRRPKFSRLLAGASFVLPSPKPREKSKELKDRLERLQEMADRKEYDALVRDVSLKKEDQQYFSSFKDQLGYGLHVIVIMFTGYLVGYASFRALFGHNPVMEEFVDWCQLCCLRLYYLSSEVLVTRCHQRQRHYDKKEEMFQPRRNGNQRSSVPLVLGHVFQI